LQGLKDEHDKAVELVPVFRAITAVPEGTDGTSFLSGGENVTWKLSDEQKQYLPGTAIQTRDDLTAVLSGKVAIGPIAENGIITANMWVVPNTDIRPLKESIIAGKQAITISPGDTQGVYGFPGPGDLVNVIVTLDIQANLTQTGQSFDFGVPTDNTTGGDTTQSADQTVVVPYTRYVLQNLRVLAVGQKVVVPEGAAESVSAEGTISDGTTATTAAGTVQNTDQPVEQVTTVYTLEVAPDEAERLVYAQEKGSIYMTLGRDDNAEVATKGVTIENLFEGNLISDIFQ
jgi:Flp pilus assembly protein CpaB